MGVPVHDDTKLFEFLILEGAQAGLSWYTILKKREHYRSAFDGFNYERIALYGDTEVEQLLSEASGIVRNRLKVASEIRNANAFLRVREEFGSFASYLWGFVDGKPVVNHWASLKDVPVSTELSDKISKDLKRRGFNFVGTTIVYSYLQAVGVVMDHIQTCFRYYDLTR
ncbi:DNA-3-methyladenine glycosylase [Alicyclobacillus fastidiosus]|nr:DNA-3-methyladenine glycosylase [Alicyclobacillus fastidiosus]